MNSKIRKPLFVLFLIVLVSACGSVSIVKVQSDADDAYLKQNYGEHGIHFVNVLQESSFNYMMNAMRSGIIDNQNLNDTQRETEIKKINAIQFVKNGYLVFNIRVPQPLYQKQYNLKFTLTDNTGVRAYKDLRYLYMKNLVSYGNVSGINFDYVWIFRLNKTLDTMQPGELPLKLSVTYPNDRTNVYLIKP